MLLHYCPAGTAAQDRAAALPVLSSEQGGLPTHGCQLHCASSHLNCSCGLFCLLRLVLMPIFLSRSNVLDIYSIPEVPVLLTAKPTLEVVLIKFP